MNLQILSQSEADHRYMFPPQYGTMYLLLTTYNSVFVDIYNESVGIASLNYISLAIGFTIGGQAGRIVDLIYRRLRAKNGGKGLPGEQKTGDTDACGRFADRGAG